jgi:hypothetical protein
MTVQRREGRPPPDPEELDPLEPPDRLEPPELPDPLDPEDPELDGGL